MEEDTDHIDPKHKKRFVIEVSGPEDSLPDDDDNWFWQISPDNDDVIDAMFPVLTRLNPPPKEPPDAAT
jgi:hypothetical protein